MCGIAGFSVKNSILNAQKVIEDMTVSIAHRGPNGMHFWNSSNVYFGHRRLSILDLSEAGTQPMSSESGRFTIVFNGEIYNHLDIRKEIEALGFNRWKGHSDTETIVAGLEFFSIEALCQKFVGMFTIAVFDSQDQSLKVVRDRFGEKPLYYFSNSETFVFGSELKVLLQFPGIPQEIDNDALDDFFKYAYILEPKTIFKKIRKLRASSILTVTKDFEVSEKKYWSLNQEFASIEKPSRVALALFANELIEVSTREQLISDVPLGCFLSGGIDSSIIASTMQKASAGKVRTFSVGFSEEEFDESKTASEVAKFIGVDHTTIIADPARALDFIKNVSKYLDEPFGDSSAIPTFLLVEEVRKHVTVAISGDGGDELFGGYSRYRTALKFRKILLVPLFVRKILMAFVLLLSKVGFGSRKSISRVLGLLGAISEDDIYDVLLTNWFQSPVKNGKQLPKTELEKTGSFLKDMMLWDLKNYLPGDILVKVDRMSMAVSLETRAPFLSHKLASWAWKLRSADLVDKNNGKIVLKEVLTNLIPKSLWDRPKKGFTVPLAEWMRKDLRELFENSFSVSRLQQAGLKAEMVREMWDEHKAGKEDWYRQLWLAYVWISWREKYLKDAYVG